MTQQTIKTPGFNCRVAIFFQSDKNGRKLAYYWTNKSGRAIRVPLADAEIWIAQDLADLLPGHPLKEQPATKKESLPAEEATRKVESDFWNRALQPEPDVQTLLDEAVLRAIALGRPFEDHEVFGFIWDTYQLELVPQMDRRFVLLQEATGTTERVWGVRPDPTGLRASVDTYLEQIIIQRGLVQFFQAVSEYTNKHLLGPDDMFVRGTCGHRYITQYAGRADLLAKLGRDCPKCLPHEQESLPLAK